MRITNRIETKVCIAGYSFLCVNNSLIIGTLAKGLPGPSVTSNIHLQQGSLAMPTVTRSRLCIAPLMVAAGALIATPLLAQAQGQNRMPRECVAEIRDLCAPDGARDRGAIRTCLREKLGELSDECSAQLRQRMQQRGQETGQQRGVDGRRGGAALVNPYQALAKPDRTVIYGEHQRQQVDIYEPEDAVEPLPLVLFIHGGGWTMGSHQAVQTKPAFFKSAGYYFASAGYQLVPDVTVEQQAADLGEALRAVRGQASAIGFDPDRIVLMGHSAGAHLAALLASDPAYAGDAFGAIRGVVLLDGAGYDVAANIANGGPQVWQIYNRAFGNDPARQAALSPMTHVGGADAPNWLGLYVAERELSKAQTDALMGALTQAGAQASSLAISDTDHGRINRELGTEAGTAQSEAVIAFLDAVTG